MQYTTELKTLEDTEEFATQLAEKLKPGDVVFLEGELGAGKTTLVQYICRALGVPEEIPVTSPTFGLVHEYEGRIPIVHADLYRLGSPEELLELGLSEVAETSVFFIEWANKFKDHLDKPNLEVKLALKETHREIIVYS